MTLQKKLRSDKLSELLGRVRREISERIPHSPKEIGAIGNSVLNEGFCLSDNALFVERGQGPHVFDTSGNQYVDFSLGSGTMILGHANPEVVTAVEKQIRNGSIFSRPNSLAFQYADLLSEIQPSPRKFAFCNSGAEATMRAIRAARGYTGKPVVAMVNGAWHGSNDWGLFQEDYESDPEAPKLAPRSAGIPTQIGEHLALLPPDQNAIQAFVEENASRLAMVFAEPVQGPLPLPGAKRRLEHLRTVTRKNDVLLGFDEVVTGFRLALGGGQEYFGVEADIISYGKIAGGGLPIGIVGTSLEIANHISANEPDAENIVYFGGTFSANPLTLSAGLATVKTLAAEAESIYPRLEETTDLFARRMNATFERLDVPIRIAHAPSIFRFIFTDRPLRTRRDRDLLEIDRKIQDLFYDLLLLEGFHIGTNRINFLSIHHDESMLDELAQACERATLLMVQDGAFA
jgi:glutamate-1-semialdehyde 2,1-aminomutase